MVKILFLFSIIHLFTPVVQAQLPSEEVTRIAEEAFVYGYPIVENYRVMYNSTQDKNYPQYAPFNTFYHARTVATPKDTLFVSPNVDTPYSYAVLNVKDEPVVLTIPECEDNRFIGVPFYDLYTHVIYTISPLNNEHNGGSFLIANEKWKGTVPKGVKKRIDSETDLIYVLIRTQLFNEKIFSVFINCSRNIKLKHCQNFLISLQRSVNQLIFSSHWLHKVHTLNLIWSFSMS